MVRSPKGSLQLLLCFFSDMNDQRDALIHMNGFYGLGPKPIRVALAIPKRSLAEATNKLATKYSDMYESYDQSSNYGAYQVHYIL